MTAQERTEVSMTHAEFERQVNEYLLMQCDSLLSLVRYRHTNGWPDAVIRDVDALLSKLRPRTDAIARAGRA